MDNKSLADDSISSTETSSNDKPFDDKPFDAGVEANEETDPKKFIEQLTGKLGQSLRKYNENQGQPDFELEKFAVNSLLSATHTSEMNADDQNDIIKKVKEAGKGDAQKEEKPETEVNGNNDKPDSAVSTGGGADNIGMADNGAVDTGGTPNSSGGGLSEETSLFIEPKKNNMFQPNSNDILNQDLKNTENNSIFGKNVIKTKLKETFNQEDTMNEPMVEPKTKPNPTTPKVEPITPSRKNKPFLPMPNVTPNPKAKK